MENLVEVIDHMVHIFDFDLTLLVSSMVLNNIFSKRNYILHLVIETMYNHFVTILCETLSN